jgi:serine/threonine-protein kinase RsbW
MTGPASGSTAADGPRVLRTAAEPASLSRIRRFVEDGAIDLGADPTVVPDVIQAVDESVTNIIEHGYRDAPGIVEVEVRVTTGTLVVQLRDHAPPFDPTSVPPPDLTRPLELRPLGGMGVYLARELTDEIRHRSPEGWSNELTLIKRIPSRVTPER